MKLKKNERDFITTFIAVAQKLLEASTVRKKSSNGTRKRRSRADAVKLRKQIRAARKRKVPVTKIADQLGITPVYVYQIGK